MEYKCLQLYYGLKKAASLPGYIVRQGGYAIYVDENADADAFKYALDNLSGQTWGRDHAG